MVAAIGYPGEAGFKFKTGKKSDCEAWLTKMADKIRSSGYGAEAILSTRVVSNKEAARWRYADGTKVL